MTKEEKKEAILEKQFDMAMNGSVEMLKWLGIQYCQQSNQPDMGYDELASGFDISVIPTRGQKEYEANKEEFVKWKATQTLLQKA